MEYETIGYNFSNLTRAISLLTVSESTENNRNILSEIKSELNLFFKDFPCTEILLTENTDNEFFGAQISPMFESPDDWIKMFNPEIQGFKFHHYLLELDTKLFDGKLNANQIAALLIHDINKINNPIILNDIVSIMDYISMNNGESIKIDHISINKEFFLFVIQDTVRKMTSAFEYIPTELSFADDFLRSYGLNQYYEDAMFAIKEHKNFFKDQVNCPTITLQWYMQKYVGLNSLEHKNLVDTMKESITFTGSKLVRRLVNQVIEKLTIYRTESDRKYYTALTEAAKKKMSLASQIKYSGLKSLEDDVYEYRMRIKNVETENDAIYIIRQINNRMGIISDYLDTEELSDIDRERFFKLYDKYDGLREELSKKAVYNRKMYGLFVDYNALQQMSNGSTTMNTYY